MNTIVEDVKKKYPDFNPKWCEIPDDEKTEADVYELRGETEDFLQEKDREVLESGSDETYGEYQYFSINKFEDR